MKKPNEIEKIPEGQIFQISPEGTNPIQIEYGGEFLIGTEYNEWGIQGYLANVFERPGLVRTRGVAFLRVKWEFLEFVGSVFWYRTEKKEASTSSSES